MKLDAWSASKYWPIMDSVKEEVEYYLSTNTTIEAEKVITSMINLGEDVDEEKWETSYCCGAVSFREAQRVESIHLLWRKMANLGNIFEDITKEVFLPTYLFMSN